MCMCVHQRPSSLSSSGAHTGPHSFASQRGCDPCHPHKGLQLPSVCGEIGGGFGKDGPLFLSSSTNGKPEPQRERLSCSKAFQHFLPERAALCWLPADGGAQEPQLLLASLANHVAPGWRQHTEHQGADGHTTGQHHPCPPIPLQALGSLQNAAARCPLYPPLAIPGNFGWLLWCQGSSECLGCCCPPESASVDLTMHTVM